MASQDLQKQCAAATMAFARDLRAARTARRITQEAVATQAGVTPKFVSLLETGRRQPSLEMALRLATASGMPPERLCDLARMAAGILEGPRDEAGPDHDCGK